MRYILFFLVMLVATSSLSAQKLSKYYTSKVQDNGELYFIFPHNGFQCKEVGSEFEYDLTYITSKDSVTLNFSYLDKNKRNLESLTIDINGKKLSSNVNRIFVESRKRGWLYRYTSKFSFNDISELFSSKKTPIIVLADSKSGDIKLRIKKGKWEKRALINSKIFDVINYNR